jgi:hypothetical protein
MAFFDLTDHEYRYREQGGSFTAWTDCTIKPIPTGNINIAIGDFQVRVKAMNGNNPGDILSNDSAFTYTPAQSGNVYMVANALTQSNGGGLAPQNQLSTAQKGPFTKVKIWNDITQQIESLEIGVNEWGLNGGLSGMPPRPDGASIPAGLENYYDGFGFEQRFAELWTANKTEEIYYFKIGNENPQNTNGASIQAWNDWIFDDYEAQFNRYKAALVAEGKTPIVEYCLVNQGESDVSNPNWVADANAIMDKFRILYNNPDVKIVIVRTRGGSNQYAPIGLLQLEYFLQEPNAYFLDIPNHSYIDGTHTDAASMINGGEIWYNRTYGTKDTTAPTVISRTVVDANTIRVLYSEPVIGNLSGITFTINGAPENPTAITNNGMNLIDYTVATTIQAGDTVTMSFNSANGKHLDFSRNSLANFTNAAVTVDLSGTTAPQIISRATIDKTRIKLTFDQIVYNSTSAGHIFSKNGASMGSTISITGSGTTELICTVPQMAAGDVITHSYDPATGNTENANNVELAAFTGQPVTNNIVADSAPTVVSRKVKGPGLIEVKFSEPVTVSSSGADIFKKDGVSLGTTITITGTGTDTLVFHVNSFDSYTGLTHTHTGGGVIKNLADIPLEPFTDVAIPATVDWSEEIQETDGRWSFSGVWGPYINPNLYSGGEAKGTGSTGQTASATLIFTGTGVGYDIATTSLPTKFDVYLDGVFETTIDVPAGSAFCRERWVKRGLTAGSHTLLIQGVPAYNTDVHVDKVRIFA